MHIHEWGKYCSTATFGAASVRKEQNKQKKEIRGKKQIQKDIYSELDISHGNEIITDLQYMKY